MKKLFFALLMLFLVSCSNSSDKVTKKADELAKSGNIEQAISYLDENANKDNKKSSLYHARMGYYYIELKQLEKAEEILKKSLEENKKNGFAYNELGFLYSIQKKTDLSLENYLKGTKYEPNNAESFYGAGYAYYEKKDYNKALEYFEKSVPRYKKEKKYDYLEDAYTMIIQIYDEQGNEAKVNETIEAAKKELGKK